MTTFNLNGKKAEVVGEHAHLLGALRDELGILSAKDGCSPSGQCGCCTVIMNGKARISCQLSVERADARPYKRWKELILKRLTEWVKHSLPVERSSAGFARLELWLGRKY